MKIVWDEPKRQTNLDKHDMDFADLDAAFFESAIIVPVRNGRSAAIGHLNGATTVIYVERGTEALSVVSMRPASEKERKLLWRS